MKRGSTWTGIPDEPAPPWEQLDAYTEMVAVRLLRFMKGDTMEGTVEQAIAGTLKRRVEPSSRQRFLLAFRRMREAGLLFDHEGHAVLAYSVETWRRYRPLIEQRAQAVEVPKKRRAAPKRSRSDHAVLDECSRSAREVLAECSRSAREVLDECSRSAPDQTPRDHSDQASASLLREREREEREERERESTPTSGVFETVPAAPAPAPGLKKTGKRDSERELFKRVLSEQAQARGLVTPTLGQRPLAEALARAHEFAALKSLAFEDALHTMVSEAYELVQTGRSSAMVWALRDWQPASAKKARPYGVADPSPASSFADTSIGDDFIAECEALGYVLEAAQ